MGENLKNTKLITHSDSLPSHPSYRTYYYQCISAPKQGGSLQLLGISLLTCCPYHSAKANIRNSSFRILVLPSSNFGGLGL